MKLESTGAAIFWTGIVLAQGMLAAVISFYIA